MSSKEQDKARPHRIIYIPSRIVALAVLIVEIIVIGRVIINTLNLTDNIVAHSDGSPDVGAIATMLESGLSIIGIAVSVWIGLNIYNLLQKSDLEQLELLTKELLQTETTIKNDQIAIINDQTAIINNQIAIKNNQVDDACASFISELMKTGSSQVSIFFILSFGKIKPDDLDSGDFQLLIYIRLIEQSYANLMSAYKKRNRELIEQFAEIGNSYCEQLQKIIDEIKPVGSKDRPFCNLVSVYLNVRKGDISNYQFCRQSNPPNRNEISAANKYVENLKDASKSYNEALKTIEEKKDSLQNELKIEVPSLDILTDCIKAAIGNCYYQIYHYIKTDDDLEKAENYAKQGYNTNCSPKQNCEYKSIGLRTLAHCIRAKAEKENDSQKQIDLLNSAEQQYEESYSADRSDARAHFNLANIKLRIFAEENGIGRKRTELLCNAKNIKDDNKVIDDSIYHLRCSLALDPYFTDPYFLLANAYTLKYVICKHGNSSVHADDYLEAAKGYIEIYKKVTPNDVTDTHLFYERNYYEAKNDIDSAKNINNGLSGGDKDQIAKLYESK